jgi:hypothetical protein
MRGNPFVEVGRDAGVKTAISACDNVNIPRHGRPIPLLAAR